MNKARAQKYLDKLGPAIALLSFSMYPILQLAAVNIGEIAINQAFRPSIAVVAAALGIAALAAIISRSWIKGCLISLALISAFQSYGHIYALLKGDTLLGVVVGRHRFLLPALALISLLWCAMIIRARSFARNAANTLAIVGIVLIALPGFPILRFILAGTEGMGGAKIQKANPPQVAASSANLPDIFYIILDGYGSSDVLQEIYEVDNTWFLESLETKGFYIADHSTSNYSITTLSLASSLNMRYLDDVAAAQGPDSKDHQPLVDLIANSQVRELLGELGYEFVTFETGYSRTTIQDSDLFLAPGSSNSFQGISDMLASGINEFESQWLNTTAVVALLDFGRMGGDGRLTSLFGNSYSRHRQRLLFILDSLPELAQRDGPQFVFAHLIAPHPPFVFDEAGNPVQPSGPFTLRTKGMSSQEFILGYRGQVAYISKIVDQALEEILAASEDTPIIVIQGDHGPGAYWNPEEGQVDLWDRMSILNAYLVPEEVSRELYPTITPVNSFRAVLNELGYPKEILPDNSYYSLAGYPYRLLEVTELLGEGPKIYQGLE